MKPISLTETESLVIGVKFNYFPPEDWQDEYASNWRYLDSEMVEEDVPVLESLKEKRLATHMNVADWPFLVKEDCWVLTDDGLAIFKAAVTSKPANDVESFDLDSNIRNVRLQCRAVGKLVRKELTNASTLGYTSLAMRVTSGEIILSSRKGEYVATE